MTEFWVKGEPIYTGQWLEIKTESEQIARAWLLAYFVGYDHEGSLVFSLHDLEDHSPTYLYDSWSSDILKSDYVREVTNKW